MTTRDGFLSAIELMQQSARLMSSFMPGRGWFWDWPELDNKIEAFRLFQSADRELGLPIDRLPLQDVVRRALAEDSFRAIWMMEGIGYIRTTSAGTPMKGLLSDVSGLPARAMIPLHAGMGTALGERMFRALGSRPSQTQVHAAVEGFLAACRANCRPGWEDACIESLGLSVRLLYPTLLTAVSDEMEKGGGGLRALFWHGVGRSLYFQPTNFLPVAGAQRRMLQSASTESNVPEDRRNVLAGLCWAVTLVNLSQPVVVRSLASACSDLKMRDEFVNGLISALLAWRHMAPEDIRYLPTYSRPASAHDRNAVLWKEWIETPTRDALGLFPGLDRWNQVPALYTYRTLGELHRLSAGPLAEQNAAGAGEPPPESVPEAKEASVIEPHSPKASRPRRKTHKELPPEV